MKNPIDISVRLGVEHIDFPGDPPFEVKRVQTLADGASAELSHLSLGAHAGSHLDAPAHFIPGGKTLDAYGLERFIVDCLLVEKFGPGPVRAENLVDCLVQPGQALLVMTENSKTGRATSGRFDSNFVGLDESAADWCVEQKLGLLGIDAISVENCKDGRFPVHNKLLAADILILEGLNLAEVKPGAYRLICLPLRLVGTEASPVRAVLVDP